MSGAKWKKCTSKKYYLTQDELLLGIAEGAK